MKVFNIFKYNFQNPPLPNASYIISWSFQNAIWIRERVHSSSKLYRKYVLIPSTIGPILIIFQTLVFKIWFFKFEIYKALYTNGNLVEESNPETWVNWGGEFFQLGQHFGLFREKFLQEHFSLFSSTRAFLVKWLEFINTFCLTTTSPPTLYCFKIENECSIISPSFFSKK